VNQLFFLISLLLTVGVSSPASAAVVRYHLKATRGDVNLSGKATVDWALKINDSIPAPTLIFEEGDTAEIVVENGLDEEVSIHWHGILLPPIEDGVAYVNTPPIMPGKSRTFRFDIRQHGTYWYHSHTNVQEQKGLYGAIIIKPRQKTIAYDHDQVVVLSDWSDEDANQIIKNLRKDGDYYLYKKDSMRSWLGALQAGALGTYLHNEWTRMGGMDLSDVGYDAFLINGKIDHQLYQGKPGEKVRLRIINAAASSYFYVSLGDSPMTVIAADGIDIEPIVAKEILIGMAETYDVLFEIPAGKNTELRATVQDVTGHASAWIGAGNKVAAPTKPLPDMYAAMDHGSMDHGSMDHGPVDHSKMDHSKMDHSKMGHSQPQGSGSPSTVVETLTVDAVKSAEPTAFDPKLPTHNVKLVLGGDMERYIWHINGRAIHQDRSIVIKEGDVVRFTFVNDTMMHHPMHLHGHFFRVLNDGGDHSPLKHTVDVPPHGTRTIEFLANEPGEWMLHCHNLYHMKTGMARVVKYSTFTPSPEVAKVQGLDPHLHDHVYFSGSATLATHQAGLSLKLSQTWDTLEADLETGSYDDTDHVEGALLYRRWFSNFLNLIVGAEHFPEHDEEKTRGVVGVGYMLPMLIEADLYVDHRGSPRLGLEKRFQWTKSIYSEVEASFRLGYAPEAGVNLMYGPAWAWSVGVMATRHEVGVGAEMRF
jgi:FtsP/CotA-like multicopper oxidase with cupredoxin domain